MLTKDKAILHNIDKAIEFEWLETNGLGGWNLSSIINCHTRRYHSLLVVATRSPAERIKVVSKLDETRIAETNRYELS